MRECSKFVACRTKISTVVLLVLKIAVDATPETFTPNKLGPRLYSRSSQDNTQCRFVLKRFSANCQVLVVG